MPDTSTGAAAPAAAPGAPDLLLSICIPTYNRSGFLAQLLDSLLAQDLERTEIVISDNASGDDTASVVERYRGAFRHLVYARSETNRGPDLNILGAAELARGRHFWWVGDDDQIAPGGVAAVKTALADDPCVLIANARVYDRAMGSPGALVYAGGRHAGGDAALAALGPWVTFISSLCLRREDFQRERALAEAKVGTLIFFTFPLVRLLRVQGATITAGEVVRYRSGNSGGYDLYRIFITEIDGLMDFCLENGYAASVIARLRNQFASRVLVPCTIQMRADAKPFTPLRPALATIWGSRFALRAKLALTAARLVPAWAWRLARRARRLVRRAP